MRRIFKAFYIFLLILLTEILLVSPATAADPYAVLTVAKNLESPSLLTFDDSGRMLVVEEGDGVADAKIVRLGPGDTITRLTAPGVLGSGSPVTAIFFRNNRVNIIHQGTLAQVKPDGCLDNITSADFKDSLDRMRLTTRYVQVPGSLWGAPGQDIRLDQDGSGYKLVLVDTKSYQSTDLLTKSAFEKGSGSAGLAHPTDMIFGSDGALYIADLGSRSQAGVVWKVSIIDPALASSSGKTTPVLGITTLSLLGAGIIRRTRRIKIEDLRAGFLSWREVTWPRVLATLNAAHEGVPAIRRQPSKAAQ